MLEKILKFTLLKWVNSAKLCTESSTMVGEIFEIFTSEMAKMRLLYLNFRIGSKVNLRKITGESA